MILPHRDVGTRPRTAHPRSRKRKLLITLAVIAVVLIGLRIALAPVILHFANRKLDQIPEYRGHISDVDLSLFRGAYQIKDVTLKKVQGASTIPFFAADLVDLSVEWGALLHGKLVGEVELHGPRLNFVVAKSERASQTGIDSSWEDRGKELFPLDINRLQVYNGEIHFRDLTRTPKVDVHLDQIDALVKGLTTRPHGSEALPANLHATGRAMDHAKMRLDMKLDPWARDPTFDMDGELTGLELKTLNDFLKAYAKVDAEGGTFSLYTEMAAEKGGFKGYVKPILKDVKIFSPGKKDEGDLLESAWEAVVGGVENLLENKPKDQLATQVPLTGKFKNPSAGIWASVGNLLRNGFIRALSPSLTHSIDFGDVTGGKKQGITPKQAKQAEEKAKAEP
jgi:hypothetical protein